MIITPYLMTFNLILFQMKYVFAISNTTVCVKVISKMSDLLSFPSPSKSYARKAVRILTSRSALGKGEGHCEYVP